MESTTGIAQLDKAGWPGGIFMNRQRLAVSRQLGKAVWNGHKSRVTLHHRPDAMSDAQPDRYALHALGCRDHFGQFFRVNLAQVREVSHRAIRLALCHDSWKCVP